MGTSDLVKKRFKKAGKNTKTFFCLSERTFRRTPLSVCLCVLSQKMSCRRKKKICREINFTKSFVKMFFWIHFLTSDDDGWIIETFNSFFYTSSHTEKHTIVFSQYYYYIPNLSLFSLWHWNWNRNFMQRWSDNCQYFKFLFTYRSTNCFDDRIFFMPYTKPRKESIKKLQEEKINFTKKN